MTILWDKRWSLLARPIGLNFKPSLHIPYLLEYAPPSKKRGIWDQKKGSRCNQNQKIFLLQTENDNTGEKKFFVTSNFQIKPALK